MSDSKNIEIDGIPVVLIRSKRSKRINISMAPFSGVRVAVPNSSSFIKAEQFARTKMNWIKKHHQKIKYFEEKYAHEQKNTVYKDVNKTEAQLILTDRLQLLADKYGFS